MLARLYAAFAALFVLTASAHGAGTLPGFSLTPQFDKNGNVAIGCKAYTIQAGTTATPQNSYQDSALTILQPNPIPCDATGRLPQFFLADGQIKIRVTDKNGVDIFVGDNLLVIGPSSGGGGGGGTVDPTTILATGDVKVSYGTSVLSGWVRANGRTIGSATSGATERANADCQALFQYLWSADGNLAVSGGRGASAAADWAANKTIALPDWRGRALAGLDDMGNSAAGRLTASYFGTAATILGAAGGAESRTLTLAQLPTGISSQNNSFSISVVTPTNGVLTPTGGVTGSGSNAPFPSPVAGTVTSTGNVAGGAFASISTNTGGQAHATASPMMLATIYLKL